MFNTLIVYITVSPSLTIGLLFPVTGICSLSPAFNTAVAVFSICNSGLYIPMFAVIAGIPIVVHDNRKSSNTFCFSFLIVSSIPWEISSLLGVVVPVDGLVVVEPGVVVPGVVGSTGVTDVSGFVGFSITFPELFCPWFTWLSFPVVGKFWTWFSSCAAAASPLFFKKTVTPVADAPIKTNDTSPITTFFVFKNFPFILTSIKIFKWLLLLLLQVYFCLC